MRASSPACTGLVAVLVVVLLAVGCGSDEGDTASPSTTAAPATTSAPTVLPDIPELVLTPITDLEYPTALTYRPGQPDQIFVSEQAGRIRRIDMSGDEPEVEGEPVLDIEDEVSINTLGGEPGLLGLAFSEDGEALYVSFSEFLGEDAGWIRKVVEYPMDGDDVDVESRRDLIEFPKQNPNHHGGDIHVGPDGYLYLSFGDDGRRNIAQDPTDLLAGILRIDPRETTADKEYVIPAGNPFPDGGGAPEVWVYGARNPWRFDIDHETGDLWIGDVGLETEEEINRLPGEGPDAVGGAGANLGWPIFEGSVQQSDVTPPRDYVAPVHTYPRGAEGCAVIGGRVYRADAIPELDGAFLFSDYCGKQILALRPTGPAAEQVVVADLGIAPTRAVTAIGLDAAGEPYVLTTESVFRIEPA